MSSKYVYTQTDWRIDSEILSFEADAIGKDAARLPSVGHLDAQHWLQSIRERMVRLNDVVTRMEKVVGK